MQLALNTAFINSVSC